MTIEKFHIDIPEQTLIDLRQRLAHAQHKPVIILAPAQLPAQPFQLRIRRGQRGGGGGAFLPDPLPFLRCQRALVREPLFQPPDGRQLFLGALEGAA